MNIRTEWKALGKIVGVLIQIGFGYIALIGIVAVLEMLGAK